jgi:hypothetical protein
MIDAHSKIEFPVESLDELKRLIAQRDADIFQLRQEMWRYLHERNMAWEELDKVFQALGRPQIAPSCSISEIVRAYVDGVNLIIEAHRECK